MALKLVTPPETEPVSLTEAKDHLRVTADNQDSYIAGLVAAARQYGEIRTNRAFAPQTWRVSLGAFPEDGIIELPVTPFGAIVSVKYIDLDGVLQTLARTTYQVDDQDEPARLLPAYLLYWPATRDEPNAVRVEVTAGYGDAEDIPDGIKAAIKLRTQHLYDGDEAAAAASSPS